MKRLVINRYVFAGSHHPEVADDVVNGDSIEVIGLAAGQDGRKNLVLFRCRKDEDCMCRRLLKCFEKGIECCLREHVHLIYYIYAVFPDLRRYPHLVHQVLDVLDTVVRRRIEFVDAVGPSFRK